MVFVKYNNKKGYIDELSSSSCGEKEHFDFVTHVSASLIPFDIQLNCFRV